MIKKIRTNLEKVSHRLIGRVISYDEKEMLVKKFDREALPVEIIDLLLKYKIVDQTFSISEIDDSSELGVEMRWLSPTEMIEEAFECYPGIIVANENFVPIGTCLVGSGDPYFLVNKEKKLLLYRVPHDSIIDDSYDYDSIEFICELDRLFDFIND